MTRQWREFDPHELPEAATYIRALPPDARVYVEEWTDKAWRFVYGDDRDYAADGLKRVEGKRIRVRCLTDLHGSTALD
jgi:hypothetical protein